MMKQIIREREREKKTYFPTIFCKNHQGGEEKPWSIKNEIILQEFKGGIDL